MCYLSCRYNDLAAGYCVVTRQQLGKLNVHVQGLRFQWRGRRWPNGMWNSFPVSFSQEQGSFLNAKMEFHCLVCQPCEKQCSSLNFFFSTEWMSTFPPPEAITSGHNPDHYSTGSVTVTESVTVGSWHIFTYCYKSKWRIINTDEKMMQLIIKLWSFSGKATHLSLKNGRSISVFNTAVSFD